VSKTYSAGGTVSTAWRAPIKRREKCLEKRADFSPPERAIAEIESDRKAADGSRSKKALAFIKNEESNV